MAGVLCIIVPCYNEEEALPNTANVLHDILFNLVAAGKVLPDSRILFVDDGSIDKTWEIIRTLHDSDNVYCGLRFADNAGHQNAVYAGLMEARTWADAAVTIDADLQDDPLAIIEMVDRFNSGAGVVCGVRTDRKKDSIFKRVTAQAYYRLLEAFGCRIIYNHADFRLLDRIAMDRLSQIHDRPLFLRGSCLNLGRTVEYVNYAREERKLGKSKYTLKKMFRLAIDGITGMSTEPLRFIGITGVFLCVTSFLFLIFSIVTVCLGYPFWNWKFITILLLLIGGLVLIGLGVLGAYIGRIIEEVRDRPQYWVDEVLK